MHALKFNGQQVCFLVFPVLHSICSRHRPAGHLRILVSAALTTGFQCSVGVAGMRSADMQKGWPTCRVSCPRCKNLAADVCSRLPEMQNAADVCGRLLKMQKLGGRCLRTAAQDAKTWRPMFADGCSRCKNLAADVCGRLPEMQKRCGRCLRLAAGDAKTLWPMFASGAPRCKNSFAVLATVWAWLPDIVGVQVAKSLFCCNGCSFPLRSCSVAILWSLCVHMPTPNIGHGSTMWSEVVK